MIKPLSPHKRNIGIAFRKCVLLLHMTVAKNLCFPLVVRQLPAAEIDVRIRKLLDRERLGAFAACYPQQLSSGQQQRLTLAQALVFDPETVLIDEPLGALDKQLREHMQLEIKYIHQKLGIQRCFRYPRSERGTDHVRPHRCLQARESSGGSTARRRFTNGQRAHSLPVSLVKTRLRTALSSPSMASAAAFSSIAAPK